MNHQILFNILVALAIIAFAIGFRNFQSSMAMRFATFFTLCRERLETLEQVPRLCFVHLIGTVEGRPFLSGKSVWLSEGQDKTLIFEPMSSIEAGAILTVNGAGMFVDATAAQEPLSPFSDGKSLAAMIPKKLNFGARITVRVRGT